MLFTEKLKHSLDVIRDYDNTFGPGLFLGHSGGKDSCVIYHLAVQISPLITVVHNPKKETHPSTVQLLYMLAQSHQIDMVPKHRMKQYIMLNDLLVQIDGSRAYEYNRQDLMSGQIPKSTTIEILGKEYSREHMPEYVVTGLHGIGMLYPIKDWTDEEVWQYIKEERIQVSTEYARTEYTAR